MINSFHPGINPLVYLGSLNNSDCTFDCICFLLSSSPKVVQRQLRHHPGWIRPVEESDRTQTNSIYLQHDGNNRQQHRLELPHQERGRCHGYQRWRPTVHLDNNSCQYDCTAVRAGRVLYDVWKLRLWTNPRDRHRQRGFNPRRNRSLHDRSLWTCKCRPID